MKFVLVFIVATLSGDGEITSLSLYEKYNLTQKKCEELAGVHNTTNKGVWTEQAWAVCKPQHDA